MHTILLITLWAFAILGVGFVAYAIRQRSKPVKVVPTFGFDPTVPGSSLGPTAFGWDDDWHEHPEDAVAQANIEHNHRRYEGQ